MPQALSSIFTMSDADAEFLTKGRQRRRRNDVTDGVVFMGRPVVRVMILKIEGKTMVDQGYKDSLNLLY